MIEIKNKEQFDKEVLQADKLVLVDFWADWCGPCKMIAPFLGELKSVKVVKVDVDKNMELASDYGIRSIPTILYFNGGYQVGKTIGAHPQKMFQDQIDKYEKNKTKTI